MQSCHVHRVVMQSELRSRACSRGDAHVFASRHHAFITVLSSNTYHVNIKIHIYEVLCEQHRHNFQKPCEHAKSSGARNEKQMIEAYLKRKLTQLSSVSEFRLISLFQTMKIYFT